MLIWTCRNKIHGNLNENTKFIFEIYASKNILHQISSHFIQASSILTTLWWWVMWQSTGHFELHLLYIEALSFMMEMHFPDNSQRLVCFLCASIQGWPWECTVSSTILILTCVIDRHNIDSAPLKRVPVLWQSFPSIWQEQPGWDGYLSDMIVPW